MFRHSVLPVMFRRFLWSDAYSASVAHQTTVQLAKSMQARIAEIDITLVVVVFLFVCFVFFVLV